MIPPRQQWCIQIDVTNLCPGACSNCTRLVGHSDPFVMSVGWFAGAVQALKDFPTESEPDRHGRRNVVGIMGGEPLLHPQFPELVELMVEAIPDTRFRGLWTALDWRTHRYRWAVQRLLGVPTTQTKPADAGPGGYLNFNPHDLPCTHQPVLVGIREVIRDPAAMWKLINACWLQNQWASAITPKGFFFCEVAAALDWVFQGPGGLPVDSQCWRHDLDAYREQIEKWCPRCGIALPLVGRLDSDHRDDISLDNLYALTRLGSPRIGRGEFVVFDAEKYEAPGNWRPSRYMRR